ncbi:MAG: Asp-tRNA(Asn)/Glu-tRNA(Gln) amidotransferase subunit GatA [Chloroflexi bacterium]|nr:Asp-tRNA(Asn)/Glu-tRNA(Gln) amidotransferase subunit GatA [Chloroflexota bacterium]
MNVYDLTLHEARDLLRRREISSVELTRAVLGRIEAVEDRIKAYVTVTPEIALSQAEAADRALAAGDAHPLCGVPMALKDVLATAGIRTTCSSRILENYVPIEDATVVRSLKAAGAVVLGKGNTDEFAMGSSTENSGFFTTCNPWALDRVPGGSSGGPAAAVAAGEAFYSLGTDTGGSIRQPASLCGIVGLKPTYGRVSRYGLVAFASSLDQIGPLTKDVADCALVMNVIAGHDPCDSTSIDVPVPDYTRSLIPDVRGLRLGVPREYLATGVEPAVADAIHTAAEVLRELGATVDYDVSLPHTEYGLAVYYIIAPSEASSNLARYDGVKYGYSNQGAESMWEAMMRTRAEGFGPEVRRRIMLGTYALSAGYYDAYYLRAQKVRTLVKQDFDLAFQRFDALLAPTSPTVAFHIGERVNDPVAMYLSDVCTLPINIAGIAGLSVPGGFADGLPIGLQIIGPAFSEEVLLRVGYAYEQAAGWHRQRPLLA